MRTATVAFGLLLVTTACGVTASNPPEAPELTVEYGCGFGFYLGSDDQTAGLFITLSDFDVGQSGDIPESSTLTSDIWRAELQFGADLFANWCDDVIEPGEPEPEVEERWEVSGGLETEAPSGERLALGDIEVENGFWGCFAG